MRVVKSPISLSQWENLIPQYHQEIPPGFQSVAEIANDRGRSHRSTREIMVKFLKTGKVERVILRPANSSGPVAYYRPIDYVAPAPLGKKHRRHR